MKTLVNTLMEHIKTTSGGILIHCSAGVGRTGTLYIILSIIFKIKSGKYIKITIDTILKEIKEAREKRMTQVQTPEQFVYLCTYFGVKINQNWLQSNNKDISQFYDIPTRNPNETFEIANKDCNKSKNRYKDILPYDSTRVVLKNRNKDDCDDYINANYMKPFSGHESQVVIASQCPIPTTINDFRQMLFENNIETIVMLTGLVEGGRTKCNDYIKNENNPEDKNISLNSTPEIVNRGIEKREFSLAKNADNKFHFELSGSQA